MNSKILELLTTIYGVDTLTIISNCISFAFGEFSFRQLRFGTKSKFASFSFVLYGSFNLEFPPSSKVIEGCFSGGT